MGGERGSSPESQRAVTGDGLALCTRGTDTQTRVTDGKRRFETFYSELEGGRRGGSRDDASAEAGETTRATWPIGQPLAFGATTSRAGGEQSQRGSRRRWTKVKVKARAKTHGHVKQGSPHTSRHSGPSKLQVVRRSEAAAELATPTSKATLNEVTFRSLISYYLRVGPQFT